MKPIILASASPRRKDLLKVGKGLKFFNEDDIKLIKKVIKKF